MALDSTGVAVVLCVLLAGMGMIVAAGAAVILMTIRRKGGPTRE